MNYSHTMTHAFPAETVERSQRDFERWHSANPHIQNKYKYAYGAMSIFASDYGFQYNLQSGNYAPWLHEKIQQNIGGRNCTTVIPELYLYLEEFGIEPEIVQFLNFRRGKSKKGRKDKPYDESHFALIVDIGHQHQYLLDPFWSTFGPILKETEHKMQIGKRIKYAAETRHFQQLLRYSPEQFAAMMNRLKDPAESLDMLVAGQKIFEKRKIQETMADLMIYYHDEEHQVKTRLYAHQVGFPDKVIYCRMNYDAQGERTTTSLELTVGTEAHWKSIQDEKVVARTDFSTLHQIKRMIARVSHKEYRIGSALCKKEHSEVQEDLFEIVQTMWQELLPAERDAIHIPVLSRTLYEGTDLQKKYLSPVAERNRHWKKILDEYYNLRVEFNRIRRRLYFHEMELRQMSTARAGRLKQQEGRVSEKKEKVDKEENELRDLHYYHYLRYHRNEDKRVFAASVKDKSASELEKEMTALNLSPLLGYLAIIAEYIPFVFNPRSNLEVPFGQEQLTLKMKARHAKRKAA